MTKSLLDGDIVAYRCAAASEHDGLEIALVRTDKMVRDILEATQADKYNIYLTGSNNFRKEINPEYKANRKDTIPPQFLQQCREYLVLEWNAQVTDGYEADDALGINQDDESVICSIDKDLLQVPSRHYNFVRQEFSKVSELEGLQAFYRQMLIGDVSDNVIGIKGIGKVKAGKIIDVLTTEEEMFHKVISLYDSADRFYMNADCLWIMRKEGERFTNRYGNP